MNTPNLNEARKRTREKSNTIKLDYNFNEFQLNLGKNKKYFIKTYGCQMNEHDSENIKALLELMNFSETKVMNESDLVILNTCAIRENAHNKVFGLLGRVKHLKETKDVVTIFCGCMAQEEVVVDELKNKLKWVDLIFGTHNIYNLPQLLEETYKNKKQMIEVFSCEGEVLEHIPVKRDSKYKAWINIMYGCDKFCTYCIVPYTRGKQRSRQSVDIINEVNELVKSGYKEVTLLGQNVNAFGLDLGNYNMANLLEDVAKTNIERIRFVTSHPWDFNDDMIDIMSKYKNIMPYIHLPIQSGSNKILKLMGRRYTKEDYIKLFNKLKKSIPNASITTDIIVGFPNESKEDFNETIDVVNICKFDSAFTFIFSPRMGTPASKMEDNVSKEEKDERLQQLNILINKYSKENNEKYIDKTVNVLLDDYSNREGTLKGYTDTMKLVNVKCDSKYLGTVVHAKITSVKTWSMDGNIVEEI